MSLAEIVVTLFMFGVMAAMAAPTLSGLQNRGRVNDAFNDLSNAIREAQSNAVQSSRRCTISFNTGNSPITITAVDSQSTPRPCIPSRTLPVGVGLTTSLGGNPPTLSFSFKGSTTSAGTIVVYWTQQPNLQRKCLAVSNGVGIMRAGLYTADPTSSITAASCQTTP